MSQMKSRPFIPAEVVRSFLELAQDSIALFNTDGVLEYCNPAHEQMFGYSAKELTGYSPGDRRAGGRCEEAETGPEEQENTDRGRRWFFLSLPGKPPPEIQS